MTDTHLSLACFAASGLALTVAYLASRPRRALRLRNGATRTARPFHNLPCTTHIVARNTDGHVRITEQRAPRIEDSP